MIVCAEKCYKVHIFWEGHKILRNLPLTFWLRYIQSKVRGRLLKILWPSQNIWTLTLQSILLKVQVPPWCLNSCFFYQKTTILIFFQFWRKLSLKTKSNLVLYKNLDLILSSNLKFSNLLSFSEALLWANPAACDHTVFCTRFVQFTLLMSQLVYMSMSWPSFILGGRSQTMLTRLCPLWTTYLPTFDILLYFSGNALAQVQRVHELVDFWDITFCTRRFWGF